MVETPAGHTDDGSILGIRLVSVLFLAVSLAYLAGALTLPLGSASQPGPGLFPVAVGGSLAAVSLAHLVSVFAAGRSVPGISLPGAAGLRRVAGIGLALGIYGAFLGLLGHILASAAVSISTLRLLGMQGWWGTALTSALLSVVSYWFFTAVLGLPLPSGLLAR